MHLVPRSDDNLVPIGEIPVYSTISTIGVEYCYKGSDLARMKRMAQANPPVRFRPEEVVILCADQTLPRDGSWFTLAAKVPAADMAFCFGHEAMAKASGMIDVTFPLVRYQVRRKRFLAEAVPGTDPPEYLRMSLRQLKDASVRQAELPGED